MPYSKIKALVIGGGKAGVLFLGLFRNNPSVEILAVIDIDSNAPAIKLAQELNIPTGNDYKKFLKNKELSGDLNVIINLTGNKGVQKELLKFRPLDVGVMGSYITNLLWNVISGHAQTEDRLIRLNNCFLKFGTDPDENIQLLVGVCGELLQATCALYNRLDKGMLFSVGQWNTPPTYDPLTKPEGHICFDVIQRGGDDIFVVRNLQNTVYAKTDPNVTLYGLRTYVGRAVKHGREYIGSLCVVYKEDVELDDKGKGFLGIIASAVGIEEERRRVREELESSKSAFAEKARQLEESLKESAEARSVTLSILEDTEDTRRSLEDTLIELKATQSQLIHTAKLASIGQLAAGVAHEVNNPLAAISGEAQILLMEGARDEETRTALQTIVDLSKRIAGIIGGLLEFSRRRELKRENVSVNELLEKGITLMTFQPAMKNIRTEKDFSKTPLFVFADANQLQAVFVNLMLNAVQAMESGGVLKVRTYVEQVSAHGKRKTDVLKVGMDVVNIEITDTGPGMNEEVMRRLFVPFFTTKDKGSGLGLAVSYGIIESHGGIIEAESEVGIGSTFRVRLPVAENKDSNS
ncbi:MAG: ATP-binding protein [Candidatus Omnitrophica bacterium]|nr:ATP-binding protein [Candidatus Omnitrophota bacterium]